jgi:rRNA-processing protein FCF1
MIPVQFKVDIFHILKNNELFTLNTCVAELEKLSKGKTRYAVAANVALKLINDKKVRIVHSNSKSADSAIIEEAKKHSYIVATNDAELIESLKRYGIKILRLKQKKLVVEE